jgi:guanylate kinase
MKKNAMIIITGPSAVGKTTVAQLILKKLPNLKPNVTYTTRAKRDWSAEDKIMKYVSEKKFKNLMAHHELLEWAQVYGNFYGVSKPDTLKMLKKNSVLLNIDVQGAKTITKKFPECLSFFIKPSSLWELKRRLQARPIDDLTRQRRFLAAKEELAQANIFDYQIVNYEGRVEETVKKILKILKKHRV